MASEGKLYGCIFGMGYRLPHLYPLNQAAIEALPEVADWKDSFVERGIFAVPMPSDTSVSFFRTQMIHFGMSRNYLVDYWDKWLLEFEVLLRNLYWYEAHIYLTSSTTYPHSYHWEAEFEVAFSNPPSPIQKWTFEGGPRNFR
jgi:hypothetical protein